MMAKIDNIRHNSILYLMASLNISMPDELREFVAKRTKQTHHATPTEYIRSLVREDQKRAERERLEKLLLEGLDSGKPIAVKDIDRYFEKKKTALLRRAKSQSKTASSK
jgi:antitoxin ParD1/3/4